MIFSRVVSLLTCFGFLLHTLPALAIDLDSSFTGRSSGQAEYFNSNRDKRMQIQLTILSGVARPGVHQVPDNTNLLDALALAGGVTEDSDYGKVYVRRRVAGNKSKYETIRFDLTDIVQSEEGAYPTLQNMDTILIEPRPKTDQKLLTVLAIVASTVGIISGVVLIKNSNK